MNYSDAYDPDPNEIRLLPMLWRALVRLWKWLRDPGPDDFDGEAW